MLQFYLFFQIQTAHLRVNWSLRKETFIQKYPLKSKNKVSNVNDCYEEISHPHAGLLLLFTPRRIIHVL